MKKEISPVDLFIDERHSDHLPGWIAETVRKDEAALLEKSTVLPK